MSELVVILSNAPDSLLAKRIAHMLVEEQLAACVNLGPPSLSMYMWQGQLEGTQEVPLTIKTTRDMVARVIDRICELHPYEVPEALVLPVAGGLASYMDWVREQATGLASGNEE